LKISIITISYNSSETINETIQSVLRQDYDDIEYIIIDGQSTDGTDEIIKTYYDKISKIICEKDNGIYDAMNKGIALAKGNVVGFINSDDMLNSDDCVTAIAKIFKIYNPDVVYGDKIYTESSNTDKIIRYWKAGVYNRNNFRKGWMPPHLSTYIKRELYEKYGGFRKDFKIAADYELMFRFMYKYNAKSKYLPKIIARMRSGGISNKSIKNILQSNYEVYKSWRVNGFKISPFIIVRKPLSKIMQLWMR
jgi:glycosyltransferase involved in cell wall biosynthesis